MNILNPELDFQNVIPGMARIAQQFGLRHFTDAAHEPASILKGAFALFRDFGPKIECNDEPILESIVFIREHVPHSLHGVSVGENGILTLDPGTLAMMVYPADFPRYETQFQSANQTRKVSITHIHPFTATKKSV